ncbi:hypothetical protein D3C84_943040 [compost metagenome]
MCSLNLGNQQIDLRAIHTFIINPITIVKSDNGNTSVNHWSYDIHHLKVAESAGTVHCFNKYNVTRLEVTTLHSY